MSTGRIRRSVHYMRKCMDVGMGACKYRYTHGKYTFVAADVGSQRTHTILCTYKRTRVYTRASTCIFMCAHRKTNTACTEVRLCSYYVLTHHLLDSGLVSPLRCTSGTKASSKHSIVMDQPPQRHPPAGSTWLCLALHRTFSN